MAVNVAYLLGAGASCGAIPTVESLGNDINEIAFHIKKLNEAELISSGKLKIDSKLQGKLIVDLKFLAEKTSDFSSPDTYVRSLYLQSSKENEIERAKRILSYYLVMKNFIKLEYGLGRGQSINLDKRYIPFFASILDHKKEKICIPNNIHIVTWNYDFQIELALQFFLPSQVDLEDIRNHFGSIPSQTGGKSKIIHLNGVAGLYKDQDGTKPVFYIPKRDKNFDDVEYLVDVINNYHFHDHRTLKISDSLTFAWEFEENNHHRITECERIFSTTEILIIIGYSFPFFNRKVDERLFSKFWSKKGIQIYIQDPNVNESQILFFRERFKLPKESVNIIPLNNVKQFFLPPGL